LTLLRVSLYDGGVFECLNFFFNFGLRTDNVFSDLFVEQGSLVFQIDVLQVLVVLGEVVGVGSSVLGEILARGCGYGMVSSYLLPSGYRNQWLLHLSDPRLYLLKLTQRLAFQDLPLHK
jgi:hypothetical protein